MLAIVFICSNPSQLVAGDPPAQLASVAPVLAQNAATIPVLLLFPPESMKLTTRSLSARLTALVRLVALVEVVSRFCPVESVNCASAHAPAAVVSSLIVTKVAEVRLLHGPISASSPIAELTPPPASPPVAMI
jgi:hypothetical protein